MLKEDIVKNKFNQLVEAILNTLSVGGLLKENLIEAKHLTSNISAVAKGFDADKLDGHHASEFLFSSACSVYLSVGQSISHNTNTIIQFDSEIYDDNSEWDTSTYKFTAKNAGIYSIKYQLWSYAGKNCLTYIRIIVNGSTIATGFEKRNPIRDVASTISKDVHLDVNDEVQFYFFQWNYTDGGAIILETPSENSFATITRVQ